ncbi:hypothetical protein [Azospirillum soli]|uniref:hypothetical protein n=1 Tax=Azospirillum soli TaxID=1304799 RepID=UPI001AE14C4A|nr:hypothetical protein [Azospirillum soli]MBP2312774.1 hypothetical protein [Azospirillum soli]
MDDHDAIPYAGLTSIRACTLAEGHRLGLPHDWLENLPHAPQLPGSGAVAPHAMDTFLAWKRQEMLARLGRMDELAPALVIEALEEVATADGPDWVRDAAERIMFALVWPKRTEGMRLQLLTATADLEHCLRESPSMHLFADLAGCWRATRDGVLRLDDTMRLPEECPWVSLADLIEAAENSLAERRYLPAA